MKLCLMNGIRCFIYTLAFSGSVSTIALDYSQAWFKPALDLDNDQNCETMLHQTLDQWQGKAKKPYPYSLTELAKKDKRQVTVEGKKIYLARYPNIGCYSTGCERYALLASKEPFPKFDGNTEFYDEFLKHSRLFDNEKQLLTTKSGSYFLYDQAYYEDTLYKLTNQAKWKPVCSVKKRPTSEQIAKISYDHTEITGKLNILKGTVSGMQRSAGNCGTLKSHGRRIHAIDHAFSKLLFAPVSNRSNDRSIIQRFDGILLKLELWSLTGVDEFTAYKDYQKSLTNTTQDLSQFYQTHFKWDALSANEVAQTSIKNAISAGFHFYRYEPFSKNIEIELRKAILNQEPLSTIKKFDLSSIDKQRSSQESYIDNDESLLNIAVKHPEVMAYLLESGFDPNKRNAFSKTPLMYAAQYNATQSAKLLLNAGADVNIGTIIPNDSCKYTLRTSNMTPLHYAVRYADKDFISLLLNNGASSLVKTSDRFDTKITFYPIDWLDKYENEKLTANDVVQLRELLALPSDNELKTRSIDANRQGEVLYSKKEYSKSVLKFKLASEINANNIRALNNLAIASLKVNDKKTSLQASGNVIESTLASSKQKAAAYFNMGLACDKNSEIDNFYNQKKYCNKNTLEYFIKSHKLQPTKSRANTIIKRFNKKYLNEYACNASGLSFKSVYKKGENFHFLHQTSLPDVLNDIGKLKFTRKYLPPTKIPISLKLSETVDLENGYFVSTYKSDSSVHDPFYFAQGVCSKISNSLLPDAHKLLLVHASNNTNLENITFDLNASYIIFLFGLKKWDVKVVGDNTNILIVNNGDISSKSNIEYTPIRDFHSGELTKASMAKLLDKIKILTGKRLYSVLNLRGKVDVVITENDIHPL